jgi:hypothetical protein
MQISTSVGVFQAMRVLLGCTNDSLHYFRPTEQAIGSGNSSVGVHDRTDGEAGANTFPNASRRLKKKMPAEGNGRSAEEVGAPRVITDDRGIVAKGTL